MPNVFRYTLSSTASDITDLSLLPMSVTPEGRVSVRTASVSFLFAGALAEASCLSSSKTSKGTLLSISWRMSFSSFPLDAEASLSLSRSSL